ncbi:MAG: hypothetical protein M3P18_19760, partial [Actinomycetota bacterium]|nr:hypothetical protein [Actinomycetota bacterium]
MPFSVLTTRVLLTTLRRGLGRLVLERGELSSEGVEELEQAVAAVDPSRPLVLQRESDAEKTVRVHVGASASGRVIRIVPDGFGAHIAGASSAVIRPVRGANALGAVYGAALGAAEVFKHTASVTSGRRVLHRHLTFCPVTLSPDLRVAPDLPGSLRLELALIGVGAIGTGIALALGELPLEGAILAVDPQRFDRENLGTYSIGTAADVDDRPFKVELASRVLPQFDVREYPRPVDAVFAEVDAGTLPWFPLVLTALDSPE